MTMKPPKSPDEVRALLEGPVCSIPTPFKADGELDWDGVANIIEDMDLLRLAILPSRPTSLPY